MMDADTTPEGSGTSTDDDIDILNALNSEFRKSKAQQIYRFLQDQEELSKKFKEYALDSGDEDEGSNGSIGEAESRLCQQLDLRRARPANPPQAAWSEFAEQQDLMCYDGEEANNPTPGSLARNNSPRTRKVPAKGELSGVETTHKSKRKGGSHGADYTKPKRTLSKVSTRPQTAVGLKTIAELSSSFPIQISSRASNAGLLDDRLISENYDNALRASHHRGGEAASRGSVHPPSSAGRKGANKTRARLSSSGSMGHTVNSYQHGATGLQWPTSNSVDFHPQHTREGTSGGASITGHMSSSGRLRLTNRPDLTAKKLITLDVGHSVGPLQNHRHQDRHLMDERNSLASSRESNGLYHGVTSGPGGNRLVRAPVLTNIAGIEQSARNMTVLKLPPLDNNVVASPNLPNNAIMNNAATASLNPTHVS